MSNASALDTLAARLRDAPYALAPDSRCMVAFSGGLDSTFLLHALVRLGFGARLTAMHVDHGLHADSSAWSARCRQVAADLGVRFLTRRISVVTEGGAGVEGAARHARYAALADALAAGEWLMTAHHADDQLETLLYRLVRGTGVRGLRGIAESERFAKGRIGRPLLPFTRSQIQAWAQEWQLTWIDDPSNADRRFDRNYLRADVLPLLSRRWPGAAAAAVRYARSASDAESILDEAARADTQVFEALDRLPVPVLERMHAPRRRNLLRHIIVTLGLPLPTARQLESIERLCDHAPAQKSVQWPGAQARRFRDNLYLLAAHSPPSGGCTAGVLTDTQPVALPCGTLSVVPTEGPGLPAAWLRTGLTVRCRRGGERFHPAGTLQETSLKEWMRSAGVVPWMRARIPILLYEGQIVAVGDLSLSANAQIQGADTARLRVLWEHHPRIY
jgi:tRNA(Ile)-lysidine synthase